MSVLSAFRARMSALCCGAVPQQPGALAPTYYVIHYWTLGGGAAAYAEWEVPDVSFDSIRDACTWLEGHKDFFIDAVAVMILSVDPVEGLIDPHNPR